VRCGQLPGDFLDDFSKQDIFSKYGAGSSVFAVSRFGAGAIVFAFTATSRKDEKNGGLVAQHVGHVVGRPAHEKEGKSAA
jgi:hypothetical protein